MKMFILLTCCLFYTGMVINAQTFNGNTKYDNGIANDRAINTTDLAAAVKYPANDRSFTSQGLQYAPDQPDYLKKSRNRKITAWSLIGGGVALVAVGIIVLPKNYDILDGTSSEDTQLIVGSVVGILGFASMIASVPFFVSSGIYKRRANVGVTNQKTGFRLPSNISRDITSVTLTIPLGK